MRFKKGLFHVLHAEAVSAWKLEQMLQLQHVQRRRNLVIHGNLDSKYVVRFLAPFFYGYHGSYDLINKITSQDPQASESIPTEWTDEKHSLYLKSMEASFVSQLYNSTDFLGWRSQEDCSSNPRSSRQMHTSNRNPSGLFKVLRDGCWETVNLGRNESRLNKADGSSVLSTNPWIRHFRSGSRHQIATSSAVQEKAASATTSNRLSTSHANVCRQDLVGSDSGSSQLHLEMSDQNFVDEDAVMEKPSRTCSSKRMKTSALTTSGHDQVVPFRKFPITEVVAENRVSPKK